MNIEVDRTKIGWGDELCLVGRTPDEAVWETYMTRVVVQQGVLQTIDGSIEIAINELLAAASRWQQNFNQELTFKIVRKFNTFYSERAT